MFHLMYADDKGKIYDHPELQAVGRTGHLYSYIAEEEAIPLPEGATLVLIPGGLAVGINIGGDFTVLGSDRRGRPAFAVGALLPQGFSRTLVPGYRRQDSNPLPLFGYAAVGWRDGQIYVAAMQTDELEKWNPINYSTPELAEIVEKAVELYRNNRIIGQLSKCALEYHCFTAQNIFYRRWEGGIPVSPTCNARCLGCISLQPAECCPSPQSRIDFAPRVDEVVQIGAAHLEGADDGIVSFGQGCEGEPALAASVISRAIEEIRGQTTKGTINMNTNAGYTEGIKSICAAGIDSLRVSTISAREVTYGRYYSPQGYSWSDVCASISSARQQGVYVSLNLLTFPGLTDIPDEVEALVDFIKRYDINMVQIRNLNIDPDYLGDNVPLARQEVIGIPALVEILQEEIPQLVIGNFSKPVGNKRKSK